MPKPPRQFDEISHGGVDFADPGETRHFLNGLGVSTTLLEFGPGTGVLALEAARLCRQVYTVDVS